MAYSEGRGDWAQRFRYVVMGDGIGAGHLYDASGNGIRADVPPDSRSMPAMVILYVDEFGVLGPVESRTYDRLSGHLDLEDSSADPAPNADELIEVEVHRAPTSKGVDHVTLHQTSHVRYRGEDFGRKRDHQKPPRRLYMPVEVRRGRRAEQISLTELPCFVLGLSKRKEGLGGKFGWRVSGCRPD